MLIRADANVEIGTGHVMRCLALAQAWRDEGGQAIFAMAKTTAAVEDRIARDGFEKLAVPLPAGGEHDARFTEELGRAGGASWIVIDGYAFDQKYHDKLRQSHTKAKTFLIDDFGGQDFYSAALILNQNLYATKCLYQGCAPSTRLLLGTSFALLRREFRAWTQWKRAIPEKARRALVTMGGSDPSGLTARIMQNLSLDGLATTFVLGGSARELPVAPATAGSTVLRDRHDMAQLMADSDMAVICCGGTLWEALFMGCATLAYTRDELQEKIMRRLEEMGAARWLGAETNLDCESLTQAVAEVAASENQRKKMCTEGRRLVDGRGAQRVVETLKQLS